MAARAFRENSAGHYIRIESRIQDWWLPKGESQTVLSDLLRIMEAAALKE